jgi:transcriptional antiterminator NusG
MNTKMEKEITMKWYIVRAQSNRERSVAEKLRKESEKGDLMGVVSRVLVPTEKNFHLKDGKKITREKVMYPGYIFVETRSIGELAHFVKGCDGATGLLSDRSKLPQVLSLKEVERMIGIQEQVAVEQETSGRFIVGEVVKILDGPFNSFTGDVESIDGDKVKIAVLIFGRKTLVELNIQQIDKNIA